LNRKHSLILAFLITGLIASNIYILSIKEKETVIVSRIIDGDTIVLDDGRRVRLLNINALEKGDKGYQLAIKYLKKIENSSIELEEFGLDKYGRTLARIYSQEYINLDLVKRGLAKKFLVEDSELFDFSKAEEYAIENSLGIWNKSVHYGCFKTEINQEKEIVSLLNTCGTLNMGGWKITDESRKTYKFLNIEFRIINIHSENGSDNSTDIFWNLKTNVWNNDRDTFYLFDSESNIAHHHSYGY